MLSKKAILGWGLIIVAPLLLAANLYLLVEVWKLTRLSSSGTFWDFCGMFANPNWRTPEIEYEAKHNINLGVEITKVEIKLRRLFIFSALMMTTYFLVLQMGS